MSVIQKLFNNNSFSDMVDRINALIDSVTGLELSIKSSNKLIQENTSKLEEINKDVGETTAEEMNAYLTELYSE